MKRGKISFAGGAEIFRISKPGFDVDTASQDQLLLDERIFYGQIIQTGYVANPGGAVFVPVIANITAPIVYGFPAYNGAIGTPAVTTYLRGVPGAYYPLALELHYVVGGFNVTLSPQMAGLYYIVFRRAVS